MDSDRNRDLGTERSRRGRRWRTAVDVITSLALTAAAVTVLTKSLSERPEPSSRRVAYVPPIPKEGVSFAKANTLGRTDAPIGIVAFSEFQCPFCAKFAGDSLKALQKKFIEPGLVLFGFRHFWIQSHQFASKAAEVSECAAKQGKFWPLHDALFQNHRTLDHELSLQLAAVAGVSIDALEQCLTSSTDLPVSADFAAAKQLGVRGTPTFFIGSVREGVVEVKSVLVGAQPIEEFEAVLNKLLAKGSSK